MIQHRKPQRKSINKKWLLLGLLPLTAAAWRLSEDRTKSYYDQPLHMPIELAANFGEVREDHFHLGLDIRTDAHENLPVYAAADGYISRVTIEEAGYGNALYITRPNGTTTVYAHLNRFMDGVSEYIHNKQYHDECWQQDANFTPGMFPVTKGQQVALSGNTGNSGGPHLHFEIRDTRTGINKNPLLNGMAVADVEAPLIHALYWYDARGSIYNSAANKMPIHISGNDYGTQQSIVTVTSPYINFGITADDKTIENKYRLGIYKALLYVDDKLQYSFAIDQFNSKDERYVNACIDYSNWVRNSSCIQLLRILPGNHLPVFEHSPGNGIIHLTDKKTHSIKIEISDAAGNVANLLTNIKYSANTGQGMTTNTDTRSLLPGKAARIVTANAVVAFSGNAVYDTLPLHITEEQATDVNTASPLIRVHDGTVPVHDSIAVKIKCSLPAGNPLRNHVYMLLTNELHSIAIRGEWSGNYMTGYFREFGNVQLMIDTIKPGIDLREGDGHVFGDGEKAMHIIYQDNASAAYFLRAEIDGHWILCAKKGDCFTYDFDTHCRKGKHKLTVLAGDKAGNITQRVYTFTRE